MRIFYPNVWFVFTAFGKKRKEFGSKYPSHNYIQNDDLSEALGTESTVF